MGDDRDRARTLSDLMQDQVRVYPLPARELAEDGPVASSVNQRRRRRFSRETA
jgi:hypothetical protein